MKERTRNRRAKISRIKDRKREYLIIERNNCLFVSVCVCMSMCVYMFVYVRVCEERERKERKKETKPRKVLLTKPVYSRCIKCHDFLEES